MASALRSRIHNSIPREEMAVGRLNIALSNNTAGVVNNLIGGNFLTGFLLLLGADDAYMGLVTMAGLVGNLLQVMSPLLLERFHKRKPLLILARVVIYVFNIAVIALIPYVPAQNRLKLSLVLVDILFVNLINAVSAPGFMVWHIKSIPENVRAGFFSFFTITNGVIIYTVILASSKIVDLLKASGGEMKGLLVLRAAALILCLADVFFLTRIKEYPNLSSGSGSNVISILVKPFREKKYLLTVLIACLWSYSASIPGPYYSVYMLKDMKVSYSFLNLINMFNIPVLIFLTPLWRNRIRTTSWLKTLYFSMGLFLFNYIGLAFVTRDTLLLYPVSVVFSFLVAPGINLVFSNMPYLNIPEKDQTNYIGFYSAMNNLAALLGVLTGKEFINYTEGFHISIFGLVMQNKQYILLLTAAAMLVAVIAIRQLQKKT